MDVNNEGKKTQIYVCPSCIAASNEYKATLPEPSPQP